MAQRMYGGRQRGQDLGVGLASPLVPSWAHLPNYYPDDHCEELPESPVELATGRRSPYPSGCLPMELLLMIWTECIPDRYDDTQSDWRYLEPLMLVHRTWKKAIENTARLWTYVHPVHVSIPRLSTYLARCGAWHIDVCVEHIRNEHYRYLDVLKPEIPRFRRLIVRYVTNSPDGWRLLEGLKTFDNPAPNLVELDIASAPLSSLAIESDYDVYARVSQCKVPLMFQGNTPKLHTVKLLGVASWPQIMFTNLKSLRLAWGSDDDPREALQRLVHILQMNPSLEHLHLERFTQSEYSHGPRRLKLLDDIDWPLVTMTQIRRLVIVDECPNIRRILSRLALPKPTLDPENQEVFMTYTLVKNWGSPSDVFYPDDVSHLAFMHDITRLRYLCAGDAHFSAELASEDDNTRILARIRIPPDYPDYALAEVDGAVFLKLQRSIELPDAMRAHFRVLDIHKMVIEDDGWDEASFPFLELPDVETVIFAPWQSGHTTRSLDNTRFDERRLRTLHLKYHNGRDCTFDSRFDVSAFVHDSRSRNRIA